MSETLQKGWLTTRDGQLYAPATLVENVYTRSGKPYDERVREYIQNLKSSETTNLASIKTSLKEQGDDIKELQDKTAYFNGEASDKLFIVDGKDNVIAYIDGTGVNSIDFTIPNSISLSQAKSSINTINNTITSLQTQINAYDNINPGDDNTLFIIDSKENVIAYVDYQGVHSINFVVDGKDDYLTVLNKLNTCISDLDKAEAEIGTVKNSVTSLSTEVETKLQNFSGNEDGNRLFIIDSKDNVIAYIDSTGVNSVDFIISGASVKESLAKEVADRTEAVAQEASARSASDASLQANIDTEKGLRESGDNALNARLSEVELKTINLDSSDSTDKLFITDSANNVVAYIDAQGVHAIDFLIDSQSGLVYDIKTVLDQLIEKDGNFATQLASLLTAIQTEEANRKSEITRVEGLVSTEASNRNTAISTLDQTLRGLITSEASARSTADATLQTNIDGEKSAREADIKALQDRATALETKTKNFDSSENTDGFYFIDNTTDKNVVAYVNASGIHATDVFVEEQANGGNKIVASLRNVNTRTGSLETWKAGAQTSLDNYGSRIGVQELVTGETVVPSKTHKKRLDDLEIYVGSSGTGSTSLNKRLETIETLVGTANDTATATTHEGRLKAHATSISALQDAVKNVSNVMDFIGAFAKLSDLLAYKTPNKGDVAVVTDLAAEYVYDGSSWVEIGNSTATSTAISNLQKVVGHTGDLNSEEADHHSQLTDHKTRITSLENSWSGRSISVSVKDDGVVDLIGSGGQDTVSIEASHKKVAGANKGATHTKITYDEYGHVTSGSSPTTLSGYGITDAVNSTTYASNLQTLNDKNTAQDNAHKALSNSVNYLGEFTSAPSAGRGDIATIDGALKRYNGSAWENFEGLSKKLYYLDGTESGVFYFTDKSDNVVAYVDSAGISTTDITLNSLKKGSDGVWSVITSGTANGNTQLASTLKDALNNISTLNTSVASLNTTITSTGVPKWNDKTSIKFKGDVSDKTISFDGSETATIEVDLQVKDDSHNHAITCSGSGDGVAITVENSTAQNNKVAFTVKHKDILTTTSYSSGTTATSKNHNADFSFKVPKITLDDLGHIKTISDVEMKLSAQKTLKFGTSGLSYDGSADKTVGEADIKAAGGVGATDYATAMSKKKDKASSENTKSVSGTNTFITSITQNTNGDITKVGSGTVDFSAVNALISTINANITNLQTWQSNWDTRAGADIDDKIYFVDKNNNTIAYFDNDGLTVTNINLRTPNVPSGETANAIGQSTASMIFFQSKGTITVTDSFL